MKNREIGYYIKNISDALNKRTNDALKDIDLTASQHRVLLYIIKNKKVTQKEIEMHFKISHPTTVGIIKRLEKKNFIKTATAKEDKRQKIITVLNISEDTYNKIKDVKKKIDREICVGFSKEETDELKKLLQRVYENVGKH